MEIDEYDVIVIGAGHSGIEAATAAARRGVSTVMFTTDYDNIGQMSCNPAVGGLAKGQIALEVDALGGVMGRATEEAGIQFRTLNKSKGPAVQAPRAQCDRALYKQATKSLVEQQKNLTVKQDKVDEVLTDDSSVTGVRTASDVTYQATKVVVCTGTFLRGQIHLGENDRTGGRSGEAATTKLAESLERFGFEHGRLKTGTPPRIDGQSVNYEVMDEQDGETPVPRFSFFKDEPPENHKPCWITSTDEATHQVIRDNLYRSPIYGTGVIDGTGVRYCPSIEDKIVKFEDQDSHTIFLEPEGLNTTELYVNGLSTSLPPDVQQEMVRRVDGLENAQITRWGYAIEYDFYQPTQLNATLETRKVPGLFFAGQINGTTGYEEAAGQGIIAGINAANQVLNEEPFTLDRTQAYIGVLIDDLVTQGTQEPYRMFTSRAEHRLCLRKDNAHYRLTPLARDLDLIDDSDWEKFVAERDAKDQFQELVEETRIKPGSEEEEQLDESMEEELSISETDSLYNLLKRPEVTVDALIDAGLVETPSPERVAEQVGIAIKYEGYIRRQEGKIEKARRMEAKRIPDDIEYEQLPELSNESIEKLNRVRPETLGQASRISGVKPSDIQIIMMHLERSTDEASQPA
jgi:tRNA uridine 5-carboxymethylaminomethyl modification enzyme